MLNRIFATRNPDNLLNELLKPTFNEEKINSIYSTGIDINWQDESKEGFLHHCAAKNLTQSLLWLIQNGANIEMEAKDAQTPLFYAVLSKSKEAMQVLMRHKVNVNHLNIHKRTALQEAVISDTKAIADILMEHTTNLNNIDEHGHNLIFDAVSNGNKDLISRIAQNKEININQVDNNGNTILHNRATLKDNEIAIELMDKGADPTLKDSNGKNFLFYAAAKGLESEKIIEKAIDLGCNINSRSNDNQTILMETILALKDVPDGKNEKRESLLGMVKKLIDEGVDINSEDKNNETALFIAVRNYDLDSISLLLEQENIKIDHQNKQGETVLDIVVLDGIDGMELIKLLLSYDANPNIKDWDGKSIIEKLIDIELYFKNKKELDKSLLSKISKDGQYLVVLKRMFENSKVFLSNLNSKGQPLFFDSILYRNDNLFKLLKSFNIDINQKDIEGRNILHIIIKYATKELGYNKKIFTDTLKSLITLGVDVNSKDKLGSTVTHNAILEQSEQTVKMLLNLKADTKAVDKKGRSLAHNCIWESKIEHFRVLHSYDQDVLNIVDNFGILPINYAAFMGYCDLVVEMIKAGSHVNNLNEKECKMVNHLKQFSNNLTTLSSDLMDELSKRNVNILIDNMQKEFIDMTLCSDSYDEEKTLDITSMEEVEDNIVNND